MTQKQQDNLRKALYTAEFTTDAEGENPFVRGYFYDLLDILHDYEAKMYHEGWLAGEANLAAEYKHIQWIKWIPVEERLPEEDGRYWCCDDDGGQEELKWKGGHWYGLLDPDPYPIEGITHWMPLPIPPQGKEE